jgi:hypothetical protein
MTHKSDDAHGLAEEEISFTRLRERSDVMANRSAGNKDSIRASSLNDCSNRPDRRLHPTNAIRLIYLLQCGSHPQKTFADCSAILMQIKSSPF